MCRPLERWSIGAALLNRFVLEGGGAAHGATRGNATSNGGTHSFDPNVLQCARGIGMLQSSFWILLSAYLVVLAHSMLAAFVPSWPVWLLLSALTLLLLALLITVAPLRVIASALMLCLETGYAILAAWLAIQVVPDVVDHNVQYARDSAIYVVVGLFVAVPPLVVIGCLAPALPELWRSARPVQLRGFGMAVRPATDAARVVHVASGGPAEAAGISAGEVITHVNATSVIGVRELVPITARASASGQGIWIGLRDDVGRTRIIFVTPRGSGDR